MRHKVTKDQIGLAKSPLPFAGQSSSAGNQRNKKRFALFAPLCSCHEARDVIRTQFASDNEEKLGEKSLMQGYRAVYIPWRCLVPTNVAHKENHSSLALSIQMNHPSA